MKSVAQESRKGPSYAVRYQEQTFNLFQNSRKIQREGK
jgi:hypothetical protein